MEISVCVKRVIFTLVPYDKRKDQWALYVDGIQVCNNEPYFVCLNKFLDLIGD